MSHFHSNNYYICTLTQNISIGIILYYSSLNDLSLGYKVVFVRNTRSDDEEKSVGYSL